MLFLTQMSCYHGRKRARWRQDFEGHKHAVHIDAVGPCNPSFVAVAEEIPVLSSVLVRCTIKFEPMHCDVLCKNLLPVVDFNNVRYPQLK